MRFVAALRLWKNEDAFVVDAKQRLGKHLMEICQSPFFQNITSESVRAGGDCRGDRASCC